MPKQLSKEERLTRLVEKCRRDVDSRRGAQSLSQTPDRLGTLPARRDTSIGAKFCQVLDEHLAGRWRRDIPQIG